VSDCWLVSRRLSGCPYEISALLRGWTHLAPQRAQTSFDGDARHAPKSWKRETCVTY
jgi:hypothetical protein